MISFRRLKERVSIAKVLEHFGISLKGPGEEKYGPCPIHRGDNLFAFHVNTRKNVWYCHTRCRRGGSIIDLVAALTGSDLLEAARFINREFCKGESPGLHFRLTLDHNHPWLLSRGIKTSTSSYFEIGYCDYGIMKGRIAIALYESKDNLSAYMGRRTKGTGPKYLFPAGFRKSFFLYNYFRIPQDSKEVIVVEGPFDLLRVFQCGYEKAVALLGSSPSDFQVQKLKRFPRVYILLDGDSTGMAGAETLRRKLKSHGVEPVVLELPNVGDPADMSDQELSDFFYSNI